jgi:DNA polymerase elongation subunit (family B)
MPSLLTGPSGRICTRFQRKALPPPQSPTFCTKLYDKARPYFEVTPDEVDTEYYVSGQAAPAAVRILGVFGISQDELLFGTQRSLL